ncbi:hypothetical protein C8R44DRAFT_768047, partial [Mycena epipterygia]
VRGRPRSRQQCSTWQIQLKMPRLIPHSPRNALGHIVTAPIPGANAIGSLADCWSGPSRAPK